MATFIYNKSTSNVSLLNGGILIPVGGKSRPVTDKEAEHEDVIHAVRSGWVTVEGEKSNTAAPAPAAEIVMAVDPMKGSSTIPEVVPKKEAATSSAIGASEVKEEVVEEAKEEEFVESKPKKTKKEKAQ